jgi:DNA-binding transcriptional LysR family regulator
MRAVRVARGQSGILRVGFNEAASWHGVVPDSFQQFRARQPEAELQLYPSSSSQQIDAVRSRRLDAGFVFSMPKSDPDLDQLKVTIHPLVLAAPKGHPLTKLRELRLRDMRDTPFIWFPRRQSPVLYDQVTKECVRGGLKTLNIIQEVAESGSMLSFVSCRRGVTFVIQATRWRCPPGVVLLPVEDLNLPLQMSLRPRF